MKFVQIQKHSRLIHRSFDKLHKKIITELWALKQIINLIISKNYDLIRIQ